MVIAALADRLEIRRWRLVRSVRADGRFHFGGSALTAFSPPRLKNRPQKFRKLI
jgi:hypothetical protein